jgi:hypothetical protein
MSDNENRIRRQLILEQVNGIRDCVSDGVGQLANGKRDEVKAAFQIIEARAAAIRAFLNAADWE